MRISRRRGSSGSDVPSITTANVSLAEDSTHRWHVYLVQMLLRVGCFVAALFFAGGWVMWALFAAAVVLPYTAVVFANGGPQRASEEITPMEWRAIEAGHARPEDGTEQ